jgi:translocator protein
MAQATKTFNNTSSSEVATLQLSNFWKLVVSILICEAVGAVSAIFTRTEIQGWYSTLNKPSFNPPSYLFAPVWTSLYLMMGVSLWLIWKSDAPEVRKRNAIFIFSLQLFFNFWWSILFFKLHSPAYALVDIILMMITILITIFSFSKISRIASWLLVPYISWVSFATLLNYSIWLLN